MLFQKYVGGAFLLRFCIHISFELQEQLNNVNVAIVTSIVQSSKITRAEYRELQRSKQNTNYSV